MLDIFDFSQNLSGLLIKLSHIDKDICKGNSPGPGPEAVKRQRVSKKRAAQGVRSWTVKNQIKGVLGQESAGAAGRILDSANPREIRMACQLMRSSVDFINI